MRTLALLGVAGSLVAVGVAADPRAAPQGDVGEILSSHICKTHGYVLNVIRPAGHSAGSSARMIQVEKMNLSFHATWNEVENLIANQPPNALDYHALPQNPGPGGERYCVRTGHLIPIDTTVYQVSLAHANNYNGTTSEFGDSNAELAPLVTLIPVYNNMRDQGDPLPPSCPQECLSVDGVLPDSPGDGFAPGTYTTADGVEHEWELLDPADGPGTGVGDGPGPVLEAESQRATVAPRGDGSVRPTRVEEGALQRRGAEPAPRRE